MTYFPPTTRTATKTNTCTGNGAQVNNLFVLDGSVSITDIRGVVTESTNATTLTGLGLRLTDDVGNTTDITDTTPGTDCSGVVVGSLIYKNSGALMVIGLAINTLPKVVDITTSSQFLAVKEIGRVCRIDLVYSGDANTDVDVRWDVEFTPKSLDGNLTAV